MKRFEYRLESVRRVRQMRRDELQGQLADAYMAIDKLAEERTRVETQLSELRTKVTALAESPTLDVNAMMELQRHELTLKTGLQDLATKTALVEKEIDRRRQVLAAAERDVRVLDKLEERAVEQHRAAEQQAENKLMDEMAGVLWQRNAGQ